MLDASNIVHNCDCGKAIGDFHLMNKTNHSNKQATRAAKKEDLKLPDSGANT